MAGVLAPQAPSASDMTLTRCMEPKAGVPVVEDAEHTVE